MALSVLIVDDSTYFLESARRLLDRQDLRVVGVASTAAQALGLTAELRPDVVVVDVHLGADSGFDLARRLHGLDDGPEAAVILTSTRGREELAELIEESPACGFVPKEDLSRESIRTVLEHVR
jgi:DNA-binding NarL/FixJ family response regulator